MSENSEHDEKKQGEFNEQSLREIAKEIVIKRAALNIHWIVYILVNVLLSTIAILTDTLWWNLWPITGWGLALLIHTFNYLSFKYGWFDTGAEAVLGYHSFIAVITSFFIVFVAWFSDPEPVLALKGIQSWSWIVVASILGSVLIHGIIYYVRRPRKGESSKKSYMDRKIDRELEKIKQK